MTFEAPVLLKDKMNPERCALVVIDMQNDYAHEDGAYGKAGADLQAARDLVPGLMQLVAEAHRTGALVVFTRNWKTPWHMSKVGQDRVCKSDLSVGPNGIAGTWGADWFGVIPGDLDVVIDKRRYDAFLSTDLDQILRAQHIETLIFTGIQTNVCVDSTARSAFMRDYSVVVVEDATATTNETIHRAALENLANYFGEVLAVKDVVGYWARFPNHHRRPVANEG